MKKNMKGNSFRRLMLFLIVLCLFVFIQHKIIYAVLNYEHVSESVKSVAYKMCSIEEGIEDKEECISFLQEQSGDDFNEIENLIKPFYKGSYDTPAILSAFYKQSFWSGWFLLIIVGICIVALILKFRNDPRVLINSGLSFIKAEGILLLVVGVVSYFIFFSLLSSIFMSTKFGGYELANMGSTFLISLLSPFAYQILIGIIILILVFVIKKYRK